MQKRVRAGGGCPNLRAPSTAQQAYYYILYIIVPATVAKDIWAQTVLGAKQAHLLPEAYDFVDTSEWPRRSSYDPGRRDRRFQANHEA